MNRIVGIKLMDLRNSNKTSLDILSTKLNIPLDTLEQIENGSTSEWIHYIESICDYFKIDLDEFLKLKDVLSLGYNEKRAFVNEFINQYERRLKEKDEIITLLKDKIELLNNQPNQTLQ
ncbi:MAG: hypothetical protein AAF688_07390 [Bacteroidota bacterium]